MSIFLYSSGNFPTDKKTYKERYNLELSESFLKCADTQLAADFIKKTRRKITNKVSFASSIQSINFEKGDVSSFIQYLFVDHNLIPVKIVWKSKSGRIYDPGDEEIDCKDIEFWLANLDIEMIRTILDRDYKLPFSTEKFNFKLKVSALNVHALLVLNFKDDHNCDKENLKVKIEKFIDDFNSTSEKNDWNYGAVHSWKVTTKPKKIEVEMDLGSAGPNFYENFLSFLSDMNCFKSITIL